MSAKDKKDPWRGRRCTYCRVVFVPSERADARTADGAKFCSRRCKDKYRFNGGLNFDKLCANVARAIQKAILTNDAFLEAVSDKMRVIKAADEAKAAAAGATVAGILGTDFTSRP